MIKKKKVFMYPIQNLNELLCVGIKNNKLIIISLEFEKTYFNLFYTNSHEVYNNYFLQLLIIYT